LQRFKQAEGDATVVNSLDMATNEIYHALIADAGVAVMFQLISYLAQKSQGGTQQAELRAVLHFETKGIRCRIPFFDGGKRDGGDLNT